MKILGISGAKGAGKSTVAGMIAGLVPGARVVSLADPLKEICGQVFGFTQTQLYGPSKFRDEVDPEWGFAPRAALQPLGTEWGRGLHEDVWIRYLVRNAPAEGLLIIPDIRYENEARYVREKGGHILKLRRNEYPWWRPKWTLHASERGISNRGVYVIDNRDMSLPQLRNTAKKYCELFYGR